MAWSLAVWSWPHRDSWMVKNLARQIDSLCVIFFVNFLLWHYSTGARSVSTFHRALMPSTASRGAPRLRAWSRHACSCPAPRRFAPTSFSIIMAYIQPMQHHCSVPHVWWWTFNFFTGLANARHALHCANESEGTTRWKHETNDMAHFEQQIQQRIMNTIITRYTTAGTYTSNGLTSARSVFHVNFSIIAIFCQKHQNFT